MSEIELILTKLKIVSESKENGCYICDKEHSKILLDEIERLKSVIEDFDIELQREIDVQEKDTSLEHNTFITIQNTLKTALKRFRELRGEE